MDKEYKLTEEIGPTPEQPDRGRRRFTKAGAGAGAIIATLASRPVLAGLCKSPSGFASGNLSQPGHPVCSGQAPSYWAGQLDGDRSPGNVPFHEVAAFENSSGKNLGDATLYQLLGDNNVATIIQEFVAAWLNISGGTPLIPSHVLDEIKLTHMWNEWSTTGNFSVTDVADWNTVELEHWFQTTHSYS